MARSVGGKRERAVAQRVPVVDDRRARRRAPTPTARERVEHRGVALAVDLEQVHVRQRAIHDGTEQQVDVVAVAREQRAHAVDEERRVVGDDVDDGVR